MTIYLKEDTASQELIIGMLFSSTDGITPKTGLTIVNTDILIWKCGASAPAAKNSGGATEIGSTGRYLATLDATDTDTPGSLTVEVNVSGALYLRLECLVLPAAVYDSVVLGTDFLQVDLQNIGNAALDTAVAQLGTNVVNWKGSVAQAMTGDAYARLGAPSGSSVSADVAAVKTDVGTAITNIGDMHSTDLPAVKTVVDALKVTLDNVHDTDLPAVKTDTAALITQVGDVHATDLPAVKTVVDAVKLKTDNLPASPAAVGSAMTLTAAYDAATTASTQTSVDAAKTVIDDIHNTDLPAAKSDTAAIIVAVNKILGLTGKFRKITSVTYVGGQMTACTIMIFGNLSDYNSETNPIATYTIAVTYIGMEILTYGSIES